MRIGTVAPYFSAIAAIFCADAAFAQDQIATGASFTIRDISTADSYYSSRATLVGAACTATGAMVTTPGTSWFGGPARCNGTDYYFYQVAVNRTVTATFGSASASYVGAGQGFIIRDIAPDDAYFSTKASIVGLQCIANDGMTRSDGQWWSGPAMCAGTSYYFYKMAFDFSAVSAPATLAGSASLSGISAGTGFIVRDISPDDAYYSTKGAVIGLNCTAGDGMTRTDGQWWAGPAMCAGTSYYFYKASFDLNGMNTSMGTYGSAALASPLANGSVFTIRDIASDDAYFSTKASMIGLTCTVNGDMHRTDGQWWAGGADCTDGSNYYFYKAAFDVVSISSGTSYSGVAGSTTMASPLSEGSTFTVLEIASDDAYYGSKASIEGLSCTVSGELSRTDGKWWGGGANCSDGTYYYFYKMSFNAGGSGVSGKYSGYSVPKGASVSVVDVSSDDAFYAYKDALLGQTCKVIKGDLTSTGEGWFAGTLKCGKAKLYFYQVAVSY